MKSITTAAITAAALVFGTAGLTSSTTGTAEAGGYNGNYGSHYRGGNYGYSPYRNSGFSTRFGGSYGGYGYSPYRSNFRSGYSSSGYYGRSYGYPSYGNRSYGYGNRGYSSRGYGYSNYGGYGYGGGRSGISLGFRF